MKNFYIQQDFLTHQNVLLPEDESHHALKVLRVKEGEQIGLYNGQGQMAVARMEGKAGKLCACRVEEVYTQPQPAPSFHIALALLKSKERMEWFMEKAVEMGAAGITFFYAARTEKKGLDADRMMRLAISAMKQSGNYWLPEIRCGIKYADLVKENSEGERFIAYCPVETTDILQKAYTKGTSATILIGPEGDFTQEEVDLALSAGYREVSLGPLRLRAETAAMAALVYLQAYNH